MRDRLKMRGWTESILRDVRLGLRMLRTSPAVAATSILSLGLALGACVAAFSVVDALILRSLPVRDPGRLVYLGFPTYTSERPESDTYNDPLFVRLRDAGRGHVDLFAMSTQVMRAVIFGGGDGEKEKVRTQFMSGDAFDLLGAAPAMGRLLSRQDDQSAAVAAVISHAFWMRRFGGDPRIVGSWLSLDVRPFQIVGIASARFTGVEPGRPTDVWLPYASYNPRAFGNPQFNWFRIFGRLNADVRVEQAQTVLQAAFTSFRAEYAAQLVELDRSPQNLKRFLETPLYVRSAGNGPSPLRREFERPLWILTLIAALIVVVAGSNVANLFLARAAAREREMALRVSIGASRSRLIQQTLVESTLVALAACALGLVFAAIAAPSVVRLLGSADDPVHLDLAMDWRLAAGAAAMTLLTTALFGLTPALRASAVAPVTALKTGGDRTGTRTRMMRPFVVLQVAFSVLVLFIGGLLVLSFARLSRVNPGFASSNVLLVSIEPIQRTDAGRQRAALFELIDRLRSIAGVEAVSSAEFNLLGRAWTHNLRIPGQQYETVESTVAPVTSGFFETMNIAVRAGRVFDRRDIASEHANAIVVNEAFVRRYFGDRPAVGRTLDTRFGDMDDPGVHEIVGVVADTRYDLRKPAAPMIYIPLRLRSTGTIHVRGTGDDTALVSRIREEIRGGSAVFRVTSIRPQSEAIGQTLLRERLLALLSGYFASIGLVLVAVGLYGILSYSVHQRTREIGIRVALGARQLGVIRLVLAQTGTMGAIGAVCGLAGGLYVSRFVEALLFEVTPRDFWSLALPLALLVLAAVLAAMRPAVRAARVDPVIALRYE